MQQTISEWRLQNRIWLRLTIVVIVIGALVIVLAVGTLPGIIHPWVEFVSSDRPSLSDVQKQLQAEQLREVSLHEQLDSLERWYSQLNSESELLQKAQLCARLQQVILIGYDRMNAESGKRSDALAYHLLVEGRFQAIARLVADLETLPQAVRIQSLALEGRSAGGAQLRGTIIIRRGEP